MLENDELLIHPWRQAVPWAGSPALLPNESLRLIAAGADRTIIGLVREPGAPRRGLWSWLGGRTLHVCETEDASLVFALARGLWRGWEVIDAEDSLVGSIQRRLLLNENGAPLACVASQGDTGQFHTLDHQTLARWRRLGKAHYQLRFVTGPAANPFVRMVLLGAVLTW